MDDCPVFLGNSSSSESSPISRISRAFARYERKLRGQDEPPPPYEEPPGYAVALEMEKQEESENAKENSVSRL